MSDIIQVLKEISEIEHWMRLPAAEGSVEALSLAPIITWRYKQPSIELAAMLNAAISTFAGTIAWDLTITDRNWSLKPSRLAEYARVHGCTGTFTAARELKNSEPEFGMRANGELRQLAEHIHSHLAARGRRAS
jgi:hypothetical protein